MNSAAVGMTMCAAMLQPTASGGASEIKMIWPPRVATSCMLETVFSKSSSFGATTITGTFSSIRAMGPCFSSPAA